MTDSFSPRPSRGIGSLVAGIVLLVIGIITFVLFATIAAPGGANPEAWRSLVWIGAAGATATGASLVIYSVSKRRRRRADGERRNP